MGTVRSIICSVRTTIRQKLGLKTPTPETKTIIYLEQKELKEEINQLLSEMNHVQNQFENETDFDMIEAYIWQMRSLETRYSHALKKVKSALSCE